MTRVPHLSDTRPAKAVLARGDARAIPLRDSSVDLVVTSPPFWQVRGYKDRGTAYDGQIGGERTIDAWLAEMWHVMSEAARTLKRTGSIFVHLQDKWNSDTGGRNDRDLGSGVLSSDAPYKSLALIPQRFAEGCVDPDYAAWRMTRAGLPADRVETITKHLPLVLREEIIVWRYNGMPETVHDRCRRQHEYLWHFTLEPDYFADIDVLRTAHQHPDHAQLGKQHTGERWSSDTLATGTRRWAVAERQLDPKGVPPVSVWEIKTEAFRMPRGLHHDDGQHGTVRTPAALLADLNAGRSPIPVRPAEVHTAVFPPELVERCVAGWSPTGWINDQPLTAEQAATTNQPTTRSVVLDPFSGTGTTALVARALGRDAVGIDLSNDYTQIARWRTSDPSQATKVLERRNSSAQTSLF